MEKLEWSSIEEELKEHFISSAQTFSSKICDSIQKKYDEARSEIEKLRKEMNESIELERRKFEEEKQKELAWMNDEKMSNDISKTANFVEISMEWEKIEREKKIVAEFNESHESQIKLDVGGKLFTTTTTTLTKVPDSMLSVMFSGKYPIKKNEDGRVFIDRDGALFRTILDFLRDGEFEIPNDEKMINKLLREVKYFGLTQMEKIILDHCNQNDSAPSTVSYMAKNGCMLEFDTRFEACRKFGFYAKERITTPKGSATVIGVRDGSLWVHIDGDRGASYWDGYKTFQELSKLGFALLESHPESK